MKELSWLEFVAWFDASVHEQLRAALDKPGIVALVLFENQLMDSSHFGERTALRVGPECTYKDVAACEGHWLNDLPSQRQYPVAFVRREG